MRTTDLAASENSSAITRLTALWALTESGLGGIMFAFRIPFTGFLIGAVAIVLLSLIARFSNYSYKQLISSTIIVIMVKAAVSPHSPLPAYFAVLFQGFLAAFLFSFLRSYKLACVLLGILSMAESSLQKIIVLMLLFGKSIWEATNNLGKEIGNTFSLSTDHNYALWMIGGYVLIYMLWGAVVGGFAAGTPASIEKHTDSIIKNYHRIKATQPCYAGQFAQQKKWKRWIAFTGVLLFILLVFVFSGAGGQRVAAIILRSVAAILLLLFIVQPLLQFLFNKWLSRRTAAEKKKSAEVMQLLPLLRSYVPDAYAMTKNGKGFFKRLRYFLLAMIVLTLYAERE